jgi:hypothetical protein
MPAIARGQTSDGAHPVLEVFTPAQGVLLDATAVAFQVFDVSDDARQASPVQVFPATPGSRATANLAELAPAGDKLGTGHVLARWTVPVDEALGRHEIRWFVQSTPGATEQVVTAEFDVLAAGAGSYRSGYALVSDLRAEGVTPSEATDARLARLVRLATQYVDRMTGRFFEPRPMTPALDGSGGRILLLGHPIIGVRDVTLLVAMPAEVGELPVVPSFFRVYNRHLTQGLLDPDDRENPRLEFFHESDLLGVQATPAASLGLGSLVWLRGVPERGDQRPVRLHGPGRLPDGPHAGTHPPRHQAARAARDPDDDGHVPARGPSEALAHRQRANARPGLQPRASARARRLQRRSDD